MNEDQDRELSFEQLVEKYQKKIYNLILHQVDDVETALDLTQETFVTAYRRWRSFDGSCKVHTWLCEIAIRQCKAWVQQRLRRQHPHEQDPSLN